MVAYIYDPKCYKHDTGVHLEIYDRCKKIDSMIKSKYNLLELPLIEGIKSELYKIHDSSYVDWVESGYDNGIRMIISSDTILSKNSYEIALRAACSTKSVIKAFKNSDTNRAFLNLRPPGHHAEIITGQGFCIFNNIALMAKYAQEEGYKKVLIIDFDVHHGNGTQDIFYEDKNVYYFSTHEAQNYPFTGEIDEIGKNEGIGFNKNIPYKNAINDEEFLKLFNELPSNFSPDILLISAGYDLMSKEDISSSNLSFKGLRAMIKLILKRYHTIPIAFVLEGGYNINSLVQSVDITIEEIVNNI